MTPRSRAGAGVTAAVVALLWLGVSSPRAAAGDRCVAVGYVAGLDRAASVLAATPPDVAAARAQLLQLVAASPSARAVLRPVLSDLETVPPDTADAQQRLATLRATLALPPGSTCHDDPGAARRLLDQVYASPVFANLDQSPQPGILERIGQALAWLASHVRGTLGTSGSIALGAIVLALALALAARQLSGVLAGSPARLAAEHPERGTDPDAEWRLALAAAQRGAYREAIRRAFRSALLDAAGRGRLNADTSWTTRELLASIEGDPALRGAVLAAAAEFDFAWYSGRPSDAMSWERARARCDAVRALARRAPETAAA